jgi:hypothetical protein
LKAHESGDYPGTPKVEIAVILVAPAAPAGEKQKATAEGGCATWPRSSQKFFPLLICSPITIYLESSVHEQGISQR